MREDGQGAGSVKSEALDGAGVDRGLMDYLLYAVANTCPYVCRRLFLSPMLALGSKSLETLEVRASHIVSCLRLPELDWLRGECLDVPRGINEAGSGRTSAYIDTDKVILNNNVNSHLEKWWVGLNLVCGRGGNLHCFQCE